jgi:hypothetical protein
MSLRVAEEWLENPAGKSLTADKHFHASHFKQMNYKIVRTAVFEEVASVAVMVAELLVPTRLVRTKNVADVFPAGIVSEAGTLADVELLDSSTSSPFLPAGPLNVIVPVKLLPPRIVLGLNDIWLTVGRAKYGLSETTSA